MSNSKKVTVIEQKVTAAQIVTDCPDQLQRIGHEITERLAKVDKQAQQANDHLIAVNQLLAEAKKLCDGGGFKQFREQFCPQLGKSQAYAMLAIAAGKKTFIGHRTEERERKQRTRANQKAVPAANSGTVPENSEPKESSNAAAPPATTPKPLAKLKTATAARGTASKEFTDHGARLLQTIKGAKPRHFIDTGLNPDELPRLDILRSPGSPSERSKLPPPRSMRSSTRCGRKKPPLNSNNPVDPVLAGCPVLKSRTLLKISSLLRLLPLLIRKATTLLTALTLCNGSRPYLPS
jgi:hypothetical protein